MGTSSFKSALARIPRDVVFCAVIAIMALFYRHEVNSARAATRDARLLAQNALALADSTSKLSGLKDRTIAVYQRLALQERARADSIDKALHVERKARAALELRVADITRIVTSPVQADSSGDTLSASFHVRDEPFTADVDVTLTRDTGTAKVHVALDTARLDVRIGCDKGAARVGVVAPKWLAVDVARGTTVDPDLCNPAYTKPTFIQRARHDAELIGVGALGLRVYDLIRELLKH